MISVKDAKFGLWVRRYIVKGVDGGLSHDISVWGAHFLRCCYKPVLINLAALNHELDVIRLGKVEEEAGVVARNRIQVIGRVFTV